MNKIRGICLVKDEADIIQQSLVAACGWCDEIYVYDNGSTDETWEIVNELSKVQKKIVPFRSEAISFRNGLRANVFNEFKNRAKEGDWWCILDSDEFYIEDPRIFLAKVGMRFDSVWHASFQYFFTDKDYKRYLKDPALYADDVLVHEKIRYYLNNWSELRFFRHSHKLSWDVHQGYPVKLKTVFPQRIWARHYQYRSPQQIQRRLDIRRTAKNPFVHEMQVDWKSTVFDTSTTSRKNLRDDSDAPLWTERLLEAEKLHYDGLDGQYNSGEDLMPALPASFSIIFDDFCSLLSRRIVSIGRRLVLRFRYLLVNYR